MCYREVVQHITQFDKAYPPLLKEIYDPPKMLFYKGEKLEPTDRYLAIVGTRRPSSYGEQMAEEFSRALARAGFVIVSGLAYGIDAIAHRGALEVGAKTVAVLGSGVDNITPPAHTQLAERIAKSGTVISEFQPLTPGYKANFPQRNRIIAGMSTATLVIEAPERSGALITARLALENNREVMVLPANITQEVSMGGNRLIRDSKAHPVTCVEDVFNIMGASAAIQSGHPHGLTNDEEKIYALLKKAPLPIDNIPAHVGLKISKITTILSMLEIKGFVKIRGAYAETRR